MSAPKTKTAVMSMFTRRKEILDVFGTIKNFRRATLPWTNGVLPNNPTSFAQILSGEPCTPEQATAMEEAIFNLIDKPKQILADAEARWAEKGRTGEICLKPQEFGALAHIIGLRLPEPPDAGN